HLQRPEVQEALASGTGTNLRKSATLNYDMLYFAKKLTSPFPPESSLHETAFLRLGIPLTQVSELMAAIRSKIIIASSIVLIIVIISSIVVSRKLATPVQRID